MQDIRPQKPENKAIKKPGGPRLLLFLADLTSFRPNDVGRRQINLVAARQQLGFGMPVCTDSNTKPAELFSGFGRHPGGVEIKGIKGRSDLGLVLICGQSHGLDSDIRNTVVEGDLQGYDVLGVIRDDLRRRCRAQRKS